MRFDLIDHLPFVKIILINEGKESELANVLLDTGHLAELLKMLDAFENYLEQLSGDPVQTGKRKEIIALIARHNRLAVIWERLLSCGAKYPASFGREIREPGVKRLQRTQRKDYMAE